MDFKKKTTLGRTGLKVARLGIASSFGAPTAAFEEAFERGCNYFTWGTFIKGRSSTMREAIRNIVKKGQRENLVVAVLSYAHSAFLTEKFFIRGLRDLGIEYADVLILGYFPRRPSQRVIDGALRLKEKGMTLESVEWFTKFFRYGVPPHGGFCLGIERLTQQLLDVKNIRDAVLFPRTPERYLP